MKPYAESQFVDVGNHARIAELRRQGWEVTPLPGYHGVFSMLAWKGEEMTGPSKVEIYKEKLRVALCEIEALEQHLKFRRNDVVLLRFLIKEKDHAASKRSRPTKTRDNSGKAHKKVPKRAVPR
jgi:hypothetical protein